MTQWQLEYQINNTEWPLSQLHLISAPSIKGFWSVWDNLGIFGALTDINSSNLYEFISLYDSGCRQLLSIVLSFENPLHHVSLYVPWALQGETWNLVRTWLLGGKSSAEVQGQAVLVDSFMARSLSGGGLESTVHSYHNNSQTLMIELFSQLANLFFLAAQQFKV